MFLNRSTLFLPDIKKIFIYLQTLTGFLRVEGNPKIVIL